MLIAFLTVATLATLAAPPAPVAGATDSLDGARPPAEPHAPAWSCEILIPESESRDAFTSSTWPGGVVPYEFHPNVDAVNQGRTRAAMDEIEAVCAVRFVPRTDEFNRIVVTSSNVNNSFVGPVGGQQTVNIVSWGQRFVIVHELIHALGCWHEQQRPDRDDFVQINFENVASGQSFNFAIRPEVDPVGPYDFDSVMHYDQFAFSGNGMRTIVVLPPNEAWQAQIGQSTHISDGDADALAALYGDVVAGDLSGDGVVDSTDLAILLAAWGTSDADLDGDGVCGSSDLAILLAGWG